MRRMVIRLCLLLGLTLALPTTGPIFQGPSYLALALDRQERLDVMAAVVQISWVAVGSGHVYTVGVGSGTIISPDGLTSRRSLRTSPRWWQLTLALTWPSSASRETWIRVLSLGRS
jgi:hypothetical protein